MKVSKRGVNTKRHTISYLVGGQWRSRLEAVRLAKKGKIEGVTVRQGGKDREYIVSTPSSNVNLYELPEVVNPRTRTRKGR